MRPRLARGALLIAFGVATTAAPAHSQERDREDVVGRARYMRLQRAYPDTVIAPATVANVIRWRSPALRTARAAQRGGANFALIGAGATWQPFGPFGLFGNGFFGSEPQPDAGRITGVAFDPADVSTMYVASASGGVWKSTSGGAAWTPLTDDACTLDLGAIAVDPKNSGIVYAGTGELNQGTYGCGILRSTDGGESWQNYAAADLSPGPGSYAPIGALYVDTATAGSTTGTIVMAATSWGIYRSTNSGLTWTRAEPGSAASIVASPTDPDVVFTGNNDYWNPSIRGLMRSSDKGATWTTIQLPSSVPSDDIGRLELATSPADPGKVWVAVASGASHLTALLRWDDVAKTWTTLSASGLYTGASRGDFGNQATYDLLLAVDPTDATRIYIGGVRMFRSTDGGASFAQIAGNIHCDWHTLRIDPRDPKRLLAGSDGGVFLSLDGGDSWTSRSFGLAITQYYPGLAVDPADPSIVTAGAQDNGTHVSNGTPLWASENSGDGGYTAINFTNPAVRWSESQWSHGASILRVDGVSERSVTSGILGTDRAAFIPPLVMSPVTASTLYFGTQTLYRTTDEQTWTRVAALSDLTTGSGVITAIAPSPSDSTVIYIGTSDGLVRASTDGGLTFAPPGFGLPQLAVTDVYVDAADATHAVATFSGSGSAHVSQTHDGGATWTALAGAGPTGAGSLPDVPANAVAVVPGTSTILIGTDAGVWQSGDGGATWFPGPEGLPNAVVQDLVYEPSAQTLYAATYGRGIWTLSLASVAPVLRGDLDKDAAVTASDALIAQSGLVGLSLGDDVHGAPVAALPAGDANCNARLDAGDVLAILREAVGLPLDGACAGELRDRQPAFGKLLSGHGR